jgi:hypothetical protein
MEVLADVLHGLATIHTKLHDMTRDLGRGHGLHKMSFTIQAFAFARTLYQGSRVKNIYAEVGAIYNHGI